MKKLLLFLALMPMWAFSQLGTGYVGINTATPQVTFDVHGVADDVNKFDGVIAPRITGEQLVKKTYGTAQTGAIVYVTAIPSNLRGQGVNISDIGYYYFNGIVWKSFTSNNDTLDDVVKRNNHSSKPITFTGGDTGEDAGDGALGMNPNTYSMYFGNMNPSHTGYYNFGFGYNVFPRITTGSYNTATGHESANSITTAKYNSLYGYLSGWKLTTGNSNSYFGDEVAFSNVLGYKNTISGMGAAYHSSGGNYNSIYGYKAAGNKQIGNYNLILGAHAAAHKSGSEGKIGNNNILIGSGAAFNEVELNNKLVIHSNSTLTNESNEKEGTYSNSEQSDLTNALITGDFQERWFRLNGNLRINPTFNPSDTTYTQTLVAKPDGTVGLTDQRNHLTTAGTQPNEPIYGQLQYDGGDSMGNSDSYGFHSENSSEVAGFTIINDGTLTPSMYFLDKSTGNVSTQLFMSKDGMYLIGNNIYGSEKSAVPTNDYSFVQKRWVENLVNTKITIPAPPANGNYILTSVNGVMQWVAN